MEFLFRDHFKNAFVFIFVYFVLDYKIGIQ